MEILSVVAVEEEGINLVRYKLTNGVVKEMRAAAHIGPADLAKLLRMEDCESQKVLDTKTPETFMEELKKCLN